MKIAIIGADGQLGTDLCKVIDEKEQVRLTVADIDITDEAISRKVLSLISPDVIINTAAYHRVDDCEENDQIAYNVNSHGARNLAIIAREINAKLVHISTDYVFDGDKGSPYTEEDTPNPKTSYGISKLAGELFVKYLWEKHFLIRTCGLYGVAGCLGKGGGNFVENMIKKGKSGDSISVVTDEIITPTYAFHLAKAIYQLIKTDKFGLYHLSSEGECSWWEYAQTIFDLLKMPITVQKTSASQIKAKAHRPKYSVLDNKRLRDNGFKPIPHWTDGLKEYLAERG